eukprot:7383392-Prymnesium_polylepis.4
MAAGTTVSSGKTPKMAKSASTPGRWLASTHRSDAETTCSSNEREPDPSVPSSCHMPSSRSIGTRLVCQLSASSSIMPPAISTVRGRNLHTATASTAADGGHPI